MRNKPRFGTPLYRERMMRHWLWDAGYNYCPHCRLWSKRKYDGYCSACASAKHRAKGRPAVGRKLPSNFNALLDAYYAREMDPGYYAA
jgi:hypothetical protein